MAKYSAKMMGKQVGDAGIYAEPHTMAGEKYDIQQAGKAKPDPNTVAAKDVTCCSPAMRVSAGDPGADRTKTSGIKMRGTGAATKGTMSRGPMA